MDMQALNFDLVSTSFLNHLAIERGLSVHTIAAYRRDLVKFESFLAGHCRF
jgi:integrase/recombinase XerD